jgi:hypothetical protein
MIKVLKIFGQKLIVIWLVLLCACNSTINLAQKPAVSATVSNTVTPITSPTSAMKDWENRWLKGVPCRPPCFEGITPGVTTAQEAFILLQQNPLIKDVQFLPVSGRQEASIGWNWFNFDKSKSSDPHNPRPRGGFATYELVTGKQIVKQIAPQGFSDLKLKDLIQAYGEPSHIDASVLYNSHSSEYFYFTVVVYLNSGFSIRTSALKGKVEINPELKLQLPNFFQADLEGYKQENIDADKTLVKWQGFQDWKFYCKNTPWTAGTLTDCDKYPN